MEGARKVIAIEADRRFMPALEEISAHYPGRLEIIQGDALDMPPESLTSAQYRIVSNLPYNVATPLLTGWLQAGWQNDQWAPKFLSLTLMFQKEVAQRIVAREGDKAYGRLAVLAGWLTHADLVFDVDRQVFVPPPKVTSAIIQLSPRQKPLAEANPKTLQNLTAAAFGQRRKMLRASLKQICLDPQDLLAQAGISETARAEEISIEAFCKLACLLDGVDETLSLR